METKKVSKKHGYSFLPKEDFLESICDGLPISCASDLDRIVFNPLRNFTSSNSNHFRASLVELSISLCSHKSLIFTQQFQKEISQKLSRILEVLHAGSLIIDDVQDGANTRRGKPSLHKEIGVPLAINSGSWLYFWALSLIAKMEFEPRTELEITRLCHQTMLEGHLGQALDLGVRIDEVSQRRARDLSISAIKLKTGTLTSLATELGAVACGVHSEVRQALKTFGFDFGYALQCFNDLGEYSLKNQSVSQDLIQGRPSWIWACASENLSPTEYAEFVMKVNELRSSPADLQTKLMLQIKKQPLLTYAKVQAEKLMTDSFDTLNCHLTKFDDELTQRSDWKELKELGQKVMQTYV